MPSICCRKLYLTDIVVHMTLNKAFAAFVFTGRHVCVVPKRLNKMRLIREITLVGNFCEREISMMN